MLDDIYASVDAILENVRSVHTWQPSRGIMLSRLWRTSLSRKRQLFLPSSRFSHLWHVSATMRARIKPEAREELCLSCLRSLRPVDVSFPFSSNVDL